MGFEAYLLIAILAYTMCAFVFEWLPIDVVALSCMALLLLFGLVTPQEAVSGFSNEAVMTVMMIFILSDSLVRSGLVSKIAHRLAGLSGDTHWRGAFILMTVAGVLSAFINNVAALTIFMPVSIHLAKHYRISPSKLLLPLSYATIFGGACTLVGTSTNLLISSLAPDFGFEEFTMFEFLGPGLVLFAVGMIYNVLVPMRTLPERTQLTSLTGKYSLSTYLTELRVPETSRMVGRTVLDERMSERYRVNLLEIIRGEKKIATEIRALRIEPGDTLIVRGAMEDIVALRAQYGLLLLTEAKMSDEDLADRDNVLAEVQLTPMSDLAGRTLQEIDFRRRFGCFVLALRREGALIRQKVAFVPLQRWDTLLVFGPKKRIEMLEESDDLNPLQEVELHLRLKHLWWVSALTVPGVMILAALGVMSILKASILGAVFLLVTRSVSIEQAYRAINWTVIFLVAAILPLGKAMVSTGLAGSIANQVSSLDQYFGPVLVLAVLYFVSTMLTEIMSNNSTAVLMVPIAAQIGHQLGLDPKTFLMAVAFAASASFLTPMGYKTNAMVYGPGGYSFVDYLKAGAPLKLVFWILAVVLIPWFWPFTPV